MLDIQMLPGRAMDWRLSSPGVVDEHITRLEIGDINKPIV
jgi:hypothetical protein